MNLKLKTENLRRPGAPAQGKPKTQNFGYGLLLAVLLSLFAIMPLLTHAGLPNTADGPVHLMRQVELNRAWQEGNFYPRWGTDLALGHGMPIFSYAPPLLYHLTQLFHLTGLPLDESMKAVVVADFLLYSVGMFLFARRIFGPGPALVAAAVYVYAPYRLREAYIQGNYGQFTGLAFYPLICWSFHGLITDGRRRYLVAAAVSLAGLLLSHNISSMIFFPLGAAYLLFLLVLQIRNSPSALRSSLPPLPLDLTAINPEFPLSLGLSQLIAAGLGILSLLVIIFLKLTGRSIAPRSSPLAARLLHTLFFSLFLLLYAFLALPYSQPVWEAAPLLELAEFPWRMLGPAIFCASFLAAPAVAMIDDQLTVNSKKLTWLIVNCSLLMVILLNAYYLYPSQFIPWGTPTPADAFHYEVVSGAIGTTSTGEFLPRTAQEHPRPDTLWPDYEAGRPPRKLDPGSLPAGATVSTISHRAESDTLTIDTPEEFQATLRTLYWPGWQLYLNDQPWPFTVTPKTGLIQTTIPPGRHTLLLRLESTPLRSLGLWLTMISLVFLLMVTVVALIDERKTAAVSARPAAVNLMVISPWFFTLTATLLVAVYLLSRSLAPYFTLRSDPDHPQPADQILHVDFEDQMRLVGLDDLPETVRLTPGETARLNATVYWRALPEMATNYAVFLHLDAPNGQTLATVDERHPENIPTRNWPPGLYLRNQLHLPLPDDLPPIRYDLNLGVYDPERNERLVIDPDQTSTFRLGSVWVTTPPPRLDNSSPLARFGSHLNLLQARPPTAAVPTLTLYWQTAAPLDQNPTIFIHLLAQDGQLLGQLDGAPYGGLYPLINWLPGQIVTDARPLPVIDPAQLATIAIGLYDPATGERLPATDAQGRPLPDNRLVIPVTP